MRRFVGGVAIAFVGLSAGMVGLMSWIDSDPQPRQRPAPTAFEQCDEVDPEVETQQIVVDTRTRYVYDGHL